jgi:predicted DNA-binding protein (MmcQ/YjbR family)
MAHNGWWSLRLHGEVDWVEVKSLLEESYAQAKPLT